MTYQKSQDEGMSDPGFITSKPGTKALLCNLMALVLICHDPTYLKHRLNGFFPDDTGDSAGFFRADA